MKRKYRYGQNVKIRETVNLEFDKGYTPVVCNVYGKIIEIHEFESNIVYCVDAINAIVVKTTGIFNEGEIALPDIMRESRYTVNQSINRSVQRRKKVANALPI